MSPTRIAIAAAAGSIGLLMALGLVHPQWIAWAGGPLPHPGAAPRIDVVGLDGESVTSDELDGEVVVLEFWATWCGPCIGEIDDYNAIHDDYAARGVRLLAVAVRSGDAAAVDAIAAAHGIRYPVALGDMRVHEAFGPVWGVPTTVLIDREGMVRRTWLGAGRGKIVELRGALDALLAIER